MSFDTLVMIRQAAPQEGEGELGRSMWLPILPSYQDSTTNTPDPRKPKDFLIVAEVSFPDAPAPIEIQLAGEVEIEALPLFLADGWRILPPRAPHTANGVVTDVEKK